MKEKQCPLCENGRFVRNSQHEQILRIFWFFLIPLSLFLISFPSPLEKHQLAAPVNGYTSVQSGYQNLPAKSFLQELFRIPNLESQEICFGDNVGTLTKGNKTQLIDFNWTVNFNNKTELNIPFNGSRCVIVNPNENFTFQWTGSPVVSITGREMREYRGFVLRPKAETYSRITILSYLLILALLLVGWYEVNKALINYVHYLVGHGGI